MTTCINELNIILSGQTVVSIQPVPGSPLDNPVSIVAMAKAAENAGARALRIEGVQNVDAVSNAVSIPVIGLIKRDITGSEVRITPYISDVDALIKAGATVIAFDATSRPRPVTRDEILKRIKQSECFSMADCSSLEDGLWANETNVDIIGTTLSGYTTKQTPEEPDFPLIREFTKFGKIVMAEGRFNTPELAAEAIKHGATAVTVGTALTRLEIMIDWFNSATQKAYRDE
ncbi:N-acetylmannosamine-6-phosphate 2-epimerase [Vibrio aquaticus]|uniref:Putative N-acetylmannosamine-6-phosphate 2-epimerase n=1 Tax=Vibrio aquaticus TaxID=2496559 RepID=A0A432D2D9_9VIBR|nr:N-acetylmannosamine-6-phosphate 2-epimerase [Vibrio aquaticus]RTZ18025.1 N-acetylmannosamine-6-phosphate 2-epimerase [Vibrio aquaticus]